ncbi:hypothetical protein OO256_28725 [Pseudomonas sp. DCB_CB]|uniref:hypothetical protein n=1 Tax=unclassified Pseudomonas TaxID=196821 RepID=UPI002248D6ED|nr:MULTISPECIES: hypothetical protein [unclassified Pseudomonas]MCX2694977.1 hypothetical protein [Pseudomonas sp. DCB_BZ]MCX2860064.1 hypothetical protein [Pseudomonas sp. DCB_CB]
MQFPDSASLLKSYDADVAAAYAELLQSFIDHHENGVGDLRSMAGRCGAQVAAAHKRCKRGLVFAALSTARADGADITPTVAERICDRLLGRGVDFRFALEAFATPGRTAANKSPVRAGDLVELEAELNHDIHSLIFAMSLIRERHRENYRDSVEAALNAKAGRT